MPSCDWKQPKLLAGTLQISKSAIREISKIITDDICLLFCLLFLSWLHQSEAKYFTETNIYFQIDELDLNDIN